MSLVVEDTSAPNTAWGIRDRFKSGLLWSLVGAAFTQGGTLAVSIFAANILGREGFGEYALIQSTILTMSLVAQVATGYTATKYLAELRSTDKARAGRLLGLCTMVAAGMGFVASLALVVGASLLAARALRAPGLAPMIRLAAEAVPFSVLSGLLVGALAGLERFRAIAHANIVSGTLSVTFGTLGAHFLGLQGAVAALAAGSFVQFLLLALALRDSICAQGIELRTQGAWTERAILFRFALPAALTGLLSMPGFWLANACLARQPGGMSQVALYAAATSFRTLVMFVPQLLNNVGLSILNNQRGLGDGRRYARVFWTNFTLVIAVAVMGAAGVAVLGPSLLSVFGESFEQGSPVLLILLLATVPEAVGIATYQIMQSQEKMWLSLKAVAVPRDVSFIVLACVLAPLFGAKGVALAHLASVTMTALVIIILSSRIGLKLETNAVSPGENG